MAARANYLSLDRPDLQYSVKEACRGMAQPTKGDQKKMRRIGRYLIGKPRMVATYNWQERASTMKVFSDADWAGCRRTRKSTSGGVLMIGSHYIKSWSSTQRSIALSSGESELLAAVKASSELIGALQLGEDWGKAGEARRTRTRVQF